jgi:Ca2+-binding EF-hand superfamily protein
LLQFRSIGNNLLASNLFNLIDENNRGFITPDEMVNAVAKSPEIAEVGALSVFANSLF